MSNVLLFCYFSELNDNIASDAIEADAPELLKAILARDRNVFKKPANDYGKGSPTTIIIYIYDNMYHNAVTFSPFYDSIIILCSEITDGLFKEN